MVSSEGPIDEKQIGRLWGVISDVAEMMDRFVEVDQHERLLGESWGLVSLATRNIAENRGYNPDGRDHPELDELLKILDRMAGSKYPRPNIVNSTHLLYSPETDVRANVSVSLMGLAVKFPDRWLDMVCRIHLILGDTDPIVRLPIAQRLNQLSEISTSAMWDMTEFFSRSEMNVGVLYSLILGPIRRMLGADHGRERGVIILDEILQRKLKDNNHNQGESLLV